MVDIILRAVSGGPPGIYNVAGDGALTIHEIAQRLGNPRCSCPPAAAGRAGPAQTAGADPVWPPSSWTFCATGRCC